MRSPDLQLPPRYKGKISVPRGEVRELSTAALALGLGAAGMMVEHLDAQDAHAINLVHHPEANRAGSGGGGGGSGGGGGGGRGDDGSGGAAEEEEEALVTFEESAVEFRACLEPFVNCSAFSDLELRLRDGRHFYAHRVLLSCNPFFERILSPTLGMAGATDGVLELMEVAADEPSEVIINIVRRESEQ